MSLGPTVALFDPPSGVDSACVILGSGDPAAVLRGVGLALHPVKYATIVTGDVLADPVPTVVDGGIVAASTGAQPGGKIPVHASGIQDLGGRLQSGRSVRIERM